MDYSSKFLGTYATKDKMMPWYAKNKNYEPEKNQKSYKTNSINYESRV